MSVTTGWALKNMRDANAKGRLDGLRTARRIVRGKVIWTGMKYEVANPAELLAHLDGLIIEAEGKVK